MYIYRHVGFFLAGGDACAERSVRRVGHRFNFRTAPMLHRNGVTDCEVLVVEPNQRLSYTRNASGEEAAKGLKTVVTWTLTPTRDGALVRMEQSGFRSQGASYGWRKFMGGLERVGPGPD